MAATAGMTNQGKQDFLSGVHQPGDIYKVALYTSAATIGPDTTVWSAGLGGEISGTGYTSGGVALAQTNGQSYTVGLAVSVAYIDFPTDPTWTGSTLTGVEAALIYNSSKGNKALAVVTGNTTTTNNGTLLAQFPVAGAGAIIRLA